MIVEAVKDMYNNYGGGARAVVKILAEAVAVIAMFGGLWLLLWVGYALGMKM